MKYYTQKNMPFKVGQKVRIVQAFHNWQGGWGPYMTETVGNHHEYIVHGLEFNRSHWRAYLRERPGYAGKVGMYCWPPECFSTTPKIDLDKRICLRGGAKVGKVLSVSKTRSKLRPIIADVTVGKRQFKLTYSPYGEFYPLFNLPLDLVNK